MPERIQKKTYNGLVHVSCVMFMRLAKKKLEETVVSDATYPEESTVYTSLWLLPDKIFEV